MGPAAPPRRWKAIRMAAGFGLLMMHHRQLPAPDEADSRPLMAYSGPNESPLYIVSTDVPGGATAALEGRLKGRRVRVVDDALSSQCLRRDKVIVYINSYRDGILTFNIFTNYSPSISGEGHHQMPSRRPRWGRTWCEGCMHIMYCAMCGIS